MEWLHCSIIDGMSRDVKNVYQEIGGKCTWMDLLGTNGPVEISGNGLSEAEENIREWLTRINVRTYPFAY